VYLESKSNPKPRKWKMQFQGFKPLGLSLEGTPAKIQAVAKFSLCETSAHKKGPRNL